MKRAAGIFLHPTSLPCRFGTGDFGETAYTWIEMLAEAKQTYWQVCPLGPTGYGDSPYQCLSSYAGNPLLISPQLLYESHLISPEDLEAYPRFPDRFVDYGPVITAKQQLFRKAFERFEIDDRFLAFCRRQQHWLDDYALFRVLKSINGDKAWSHWPREQRLRDPDTLQRLRKQHDSQFRFHQFLQYCFFQQWSGIREHAEKNNIRIIGDLPYYVAYDSADAWACPDAFELDEEGRPLRVAGVPPDYFSETGQLWGNPLYRWDWIAAGGYRWWQERIAATYKLVDVIRLDHFRGFEAYWAVPADSDTAVNGEWIKGPDIDFFLQMHKRFGELQIIAEDLGEITPDVEALRKEIGFPGMAVLQFAFDGKADNPYLPYNVSKDSVMYTGTHDNNTSLGWFRGLNREEKVRVCKYLGCEPEKFVEFFLRHAYGSPSDLCMIPLQDVLGLDKKHRMNIPGTGAGNWQWRCPPELFTRRSLSMISEFADIYGRAAHWGRRT
ncbi:MAG: 4-alpha-glucanotransferase [Chitinivibrionales bacterium]